MDEAQHNIVFNSSLTSSLSAEIFAAFFETEITGRRSDGNLHVLRQRFKSDPILLNDGDGYLPCPARVDVSYSTRLALVGTCDDLALVTVSDTGPCNLHENSSNWWY